MKKILFPALCVAMSLTASAQTYATAFNHNNIGDDAPRPLRYTPLSDGTLVCHNGDNLYTRALYGGNSLFRVETSDMPIFAAYHKSENRNIHFTVTTPRGGTVRLDSVSDCTAGYNGGMRTYELRDKAWGGKASLHVTVLATCDHEGAVFAFKAAGMPAGTKLTANCCATVKVKMSRSGDIGADPVNCFAPDPDRRDLVSSTIALKNGAEIYVDYADRKVSTTPQAAIRKVYKAALDARNTLVSRLRINTPDPWLNHLGATLVTAGDGIWDGQTWQHGAVGWRMPLSGWRGAYTGDFLGWHDRARTHFDAYAASQVTDVEPVIPHPAQDTTKCMARADKRWGTQMYSNGYICRNPGRNNQMHHYDMNLCYIDELMWHLKWTGDLDYARKMWPVITSHLAWEKRNYDPDDDGLYDAYCCIWASDALYYNSGAVTHSTAYNYRANKIAAEVAALIGEDPAPYAKEADKILTALNSSLWMPDRGVWAEHRDFMGLRRLHDHPALWTVYHAIDSDVADPLMAYSATRYVDRYTPHIAVTSTDSLPGDYYTLATTDWLPYAWSINNVAHAEVYHTALAYWLAGRNDEATRLLKGVVLDGMNLGKSPANIGQISHYDAARGECYRDFGDPVGVMSRAVVQGLFGYNPDALHRQVRVRPGFPSEWEYASIAHPDFDLDFKRDGNTDRYAFTLKSDAPADSVILTVGVPATTVGSVLVNGSEALWRVSPGALGRPVIDIVAPATDRRLTFEITTSGNPANPHLAIAGKRSDNYALMQQGDLQWWNETEPLSRRDTVAEYGLELITGECRHIDLSQHFNASVTDIFRNRYESPRSPYTTLQLPVQGIGEWCHPEDSAHIDDTALRAAGTLRIADGLTFSTPAVGANTVYTSLFDNYPTSVTIPMDGKADALALLMAGSTNHMQCHMENAEITVRYTDGTTTRLPLVAPINYCPIEQDYFIDGKAFRVDTPRPVRYALMTGESSRNLGDVLGIKGVYGRRIDGGAATVLCLPLDPARTIESMTLTTLSNDVVTGLLAATLVTK